MSSLNSPVRALVSVLFLEIWLIVCIALKMWLYAPFADAQRSARSPTWHLRAACWALFSTIAIPWYILVTSPGVGDVLFDSALTCNTTTTLFVGIHMLITLPDAHFPAPPSSSGTPRSTSRASVNPSSWECLKAAYLLRMSPRRRLHEERPSSTSNGNSNATKVKSDLANNSKRATTSNHPAQNTSSRFAFILKHSSYTLFNLIGEDLLYTLCHELQYFRPTETRFPRPLRSFDLPLNVLHAGLTYTGINLMYHSYAVASVLIGGAPPDFGEWPSQFGSLKDAWSVKRFWGKVWHQLMRNHLMSITNYLIRWFPARRSWRPVRASLQLVIPFLLSGLLHATGEYNALYATPGQVQRSKDRLFKGVFLTFALQPIAIVLEHMLARFARNFIAPSLRALEFRVTGRPVASCFWWQAAGRFIGYIWTFAWISFSASFYTRTIMGAGFITGWAVTPRGVTVGLLRGILRL